MSVFFEFSKLLCFQFSEFHISAMSGKVSDKHLSSLPDDAMYPLETKKHAPLDPPKSKRGIPSQKISSLTDKQLVTIRDIMFCVVPLCMWTENTYNSDTIREVTNELPKNDRTTQPPVPHPIITAAKYYCCYDVHRKYRRKWRDKTLAVSHLR